MKYFRRQSKVSSEAEESEQQYSLSRNFCILAPGVYR